MRVVVMLGTLSDADPTPLPPTPVEPGARGSATTGGGCTLRTMRTPLEHTVEPLGTILSIWAHPDDETYLAGGVMAQARDLGQRVVCASATAGEHGTDDPSTWPPHRLGLVRRWEAAAALAVLGVDEHDILGLPDGSLDHHDDQGLAWAAELIDRVAPDTILTFGPDGQTFHPDHIAVHRWVTAAWERHGCRARLLCATVTAEHLERFGPLYERWRFYMSEQRPRGAREDELAVHVRLAGTALERKLTALRAMATQTSHLFTALDIATSSALVAEEWFVEASAPVRASSPARRAGRARRPSPRGSPSLRASS